MFDLNIGPEDIDDTGASFEDIPRNFRDLFRDLQGNILKSHGRKYTAHVFLTFKDIEKEQIRKKIHDNVMPTVTSTAKQIIDTKRRHLNGADGGLFVNFMLSAKGYRQIRGDSIPASTDPAFAGGLKSRGPEKLLDPPLDDWEAPYQRDLHALVAFADNRKEEVQTARDRLIASLDEIVEAHHTEWGEKITNEKDEAIEHFGYVDGVGQPIFLKSQLEKEKENGGIDKFNPSSFLKFVLVKDPLGAFEHSHGSFCVFRKLEQNVRAFRADEQKLADVLGVAPDLAGAYAVGRFRDGTPVVLTDKDGLGVVNNFNFDDDRSGNKCPLHAHIRKANPRGEVLISGNRFLARRAITYGGGPFLEGDYPSSGVGLLFMAFSAAIGGHTDLETKTQFEFVQRVWANDRDFKQPGVGIDPIIGQGSAADSPRNWPETWGGASRKIDDMNFSRYVTMKGGEYFFAPSISSFAR